MKKLLVAVSASVLSLAFVPAVAMADECVISNTGPDSSNECIVEDTQECDATNNNDVNVDNDNDQDSNSGNADNDGNTTGGDANSGNAGNENNTDVDVDINNDGCEAENDDTPSTPTTGGGKGSGTSTVPQVKAATTTLPDTGAEMVVVSLATAFVLGTASAIVTKKLVSYEN